VGTDTEANLHELPPPIPTHSPSAPPTSSPSEFQSLDPRSIRLNVITGLISAATIATAFIVATVIVALAVDGMNWIPLLVLGAGFVLTTFLVFMAVRWSPVEYNRYRWRLDAVGLQIRRGVIWRHQISIPIARVQHADVSQGPLQRKFELGTLTIHTVGTQNASVALEGLAHTTAIELRDKLVAQRKSGHVV